MLTKTEFIRWLTARIDEAEHDKELYEGTYSGYAYHSFLCGKREALKRVLDKAQELVDVEYVCRNCCPQNQEWR